MSGQTRQLWEADGTVHPDDSVLLAYMRRQALVESWPSLQQHIFDCNRCQQHYQDLADVSALLTDTLLYAPDAHHYPSLVGNVLEAIHDPGADRLALRKRRQAQLREDLALGKALVIHFLISAKTGVMRVLPGLPTPGAQRTSAGRLRVMPTTIALLLLAIIVVLTFSLTASAFGLFHVSGEIIPLPLQPTATVPSHAVTSLVNQPTATPSTNAPMLKLCTTSSDKAQSRIRICGSHFAPGDKVQLIIQTAATQTHTRHTLFVDAQGNFQDSWIIVSCKDYPAVVSVEDLTYALTAATELQNNQLGLCHIPIPVPPGATGTLTGP